MRMIRILCTGMSLARMVVDNTPAGGIAPASEAPKVKVIPTLPPLTDLVEVDDRRHEAADLNPDNYAVIVGSDVDGVPRTGRRDDKASDGSDIPAVVEEEEKPE